MRIPTILFRTLPLLKAGLLLLTSGASLVAQGSHPRIWVNPSDRDALLDKIENHAYAAALFEQLKARADAAVSRHQADPEAFLRELPLDWSAGPGTHPKLRQITDDEADRYVLMPYLQDAVDCGILYYLTEETAYARCAGDIMGVVVSALARMERSENLGNGGLVYPGDHLKEARIIGAQIPIACDFIFPFVKSGGQVHDIVSGGERAFPFADAQAVFLKYVQMAIEVGHTGSNWSVLESASLVGNLLCLDSEDAIQQYLPYYLTRQSERQDPLSTIARSYPRPGDIWPESLQYSRHVASFSIYLMTLLDRLYPDLDLGRTYPNILEAPSKDFLLQYPNGQYVSFGDGHRNYRTDYPTFEMAYLLAELSGLDRYSRLYGSLIKQGLEEDYDRSKLADRTFAATPYKSPLKLLWSVPELKGEKTVQARPRTVDLPFAGIYIQRNTSPEEPEKNSLMAFVGGGHYVHAHASGMNMELYGQGHVLGADAGKSSYRTDIHENYYRLFAAHNTVISNGASASIGGWVNLGIEQLELVDMEPMPGTEAVSPNHSFSTTRFLDKHNLVAPAEHERTLAVIRTSPTTGYYVDVFRSRSDTPGQFHDYLYHNLGETLSFTRTPDGFQLSPDPDRFQESASLPWKQNAQFRHPGWHFFKEVETSPSTDAPVNARFETHGLGPEPIFMDVFMNSGSDRTYTRAMAPPTKFSWRPLDPISETLPPYEKKPTPTLVVRQKGEAWSNPFAFVYASSRGSADQASRSGVQSVDTILEDGVFKGLVVDSKVEGELIRQYVLVLEGDTDTYRSKEPAIAFTGHFGVITVDATGALRSLYIGSGQSLEYEGTRVDAEAGSNSAFMTASPANAVIETLQVDSVWAANKVSFDLHTTKEKQFVAYYDADRMMTVASRNLDSDEWVRQTLPSKLAWDSHNYVTMGIDEAGYLHVTGNMHVNPLVYFRSTRPYDVTSLEAVHTMVGRDEGDVTYPKFFHNKDGSLHFSYRAGTCGNGNILVNRYNVEKQRWERYLKDALFEGIEASDDRAAYHHFVRDSEGNFHVSWIWRWTPEVATSHQICYAFSSDLIHWKNAAGEEISLPFRPDDPRVIVDPVPANGGSHNGRYQVFLTADETPVVGYVKYDEDGLTQFYLARPEADGWLSRQISDWDFRWHFFGGGDKMEIGGRFDITGLDDDGNLTVNWETEKGDSGRYVVDPHTLELLESQDVYPSEFPASLYERLTNEPGLSVSLQTGKGPAVPDGTTYLLKWEAARKSHGRHAPEVIPDGPLSPLLLFKITSPENN